MKRLDLETAAPLDWHGIDPGAILWDRFCVIGAYRGAPSCRSVEVTDLHRRLGAPPNHRLRLHLLDMDPARARALRPLLDAGLPIGPRPLATSCPEGGLAILTSPTPTHVQPASGNVLSLVVDCVGLLQRAGVSGCRFAAADLVETPVGHELTSFRSLLDHGHDDLHHAVELGKALGVLKDDEHIETLNELASRLGKHRNGPGLPVVPPFVGRGPELQVLRSSYRRAAAGQPQVVFLHGPAGSGKTRTVRRFLEAVADRDNEDKPLLLEHYMGQPGARHLLDSLAIQMSEDRSRMGAIREAVGADAGLLAILAPSLARAWGDLPPATLLPVSERLARHGRVVSRAILAVGQPGRPLVVVLEDLHEADRGAVELVRALGEARAGHLQVIVTSRRPPDADLPLQATLALGPLEPGERATFLEEVLDASQVEDLVQHLGEVTPLEAWIRVLDWVDQGTLARTGEGWSWSDRSASGLVPLFERRMGRLGPLATRVMQLAACRPGAVDTEWLRDVLDEDVVGSLRQLVEAGLLVPGEQGLDFLHNTVRARVLDAMTEGERRATHHRIAQWMEQRGASAAQEAWHLEQAVPEGRRDERLGRLHLEAAQSHLRLFSLQRARWHARRAGKRSPSLAVDALRIEADSCLLLGETSEATDLFQARVQDAEDPETALRLAASALHGLYRQNAHRNAVDLARTALATVGERVPQHPILAGLASLWTLIQLPFGSRHPEGVRDALCQLYSILTAILAVGDPHLLPLALLRAYRHGRGLQTPEGAKAMAFVANGLTMAPWPLGDRARVQGFLDTAEAQAGSSPSAFQQGELRHLRGQALLAIGEHDAGMALMESALPCFVESGDLSVAVLTWQTTVFYAQERESLDTLLPRAVEAAQAASRQGNRLARTCAQALEQNLLARRGQASPDALRAVARELDDHQENTPDVGLACAQLAEACLSSGDMDRATALALRSARLLDTPMLVDVFRHAHARAAWVLGHALDDPAAHAAFLRLQTHLETGVRRSPRLAPVYELTRALHARHEGRSDAASAHCRQVLDTVSAHRELGWALRAAEVLAEIGDGDDYAEQMERWAVQLSWTPEEEAPRPAPDQPPRPLEILRVALLQALPPESTLELDVQSVSLDWTLPTLQTLLVQLVLAARDATAAPCELQLDLAETGLTQTEAARLTDARAGTWIRARCRGVPRADRSLSLGVCREITEELGGFVANESDARQVQIGAYLPPTAARRSRRAAIQVAAHRIRDTLTPALRGLDFLVVPLDEADVVFTDGPLQAEIPVVRVVSRDQSPVTDQPVLRTPVLLNELEAVLDALLDP